MSEFHRKILTYQFFYEIINDFILFFYFIGEIHKTITNKIYFVAIYYNCNCNVIVMSS